MGGRSVIRAVSWLGLSLVLTRPAPAQARTHVRIHRHIRPRMHHPEPVSRPPAAKRTGPWDASRSSFILSAESLLGIAYARQTVTETRGTEERTSEASGTSLHVFKGADAIAPFSAARLGFDGVIGPGLTLGASFGISMADMTIRENGSSDDSISVTELGFMPRVGFLLAPSRYVGVWLRAGVGYVSVKASAGPNDWNTLRGFDLVLDPMVVFTPLPHVGLLLGPSLNVGLTGNVETLDATPANTSVTNKWSSYGVSGGLALLF